jgi:hypothetical protein
LGEPLMDQVKEGDKLAGPPRGTKASHLRSLRNAMKIEELFSHSAFSHRFMNETLRDFLNISEKGAEDYIESDLQNSDEWFIHPGIEYHKDDAYKNIKKYVNNDGREVVFGTNRAGDREEIKSDQFKGTFNYAKNVYEWWDSSEHGRWDMIPYFRKFKLNGF